MQNLIIINCSFHVVWTDVCCIELLFGISTYVTNESSINWESWSTGIYKAWCHSTWSTAAFLHQTLPVVNVSDLPLAISWSYHIIVVVGSDVGHSPWQVLWSGTCCLIVSVTHRSASDLFDQHWRHSFSQCTRTRSTVEALCVMQYINQQSSSLILGLGCALVLLVGLRVRIFRHVLYAPILGEW